MSQTKSKVLGYVLALFFGGLGAHLFYYKKYVRATLYLLFCWTYIPIILGWIDMLFIHKWHEKYLQQNSNATKQEELTSENKVSSSEDNTTKKEQGMLESIKQSLSFYNEDDVILPKYAHLKTPSSIMKEIKQFKNPSNNKFKSKDGIQFEISIQTPHTKFVEDSLKYANRRGSKTPFVPLHQYWTTFDALNEDQKKWYFYWREQVLKGNYLDTDLSYIILFTYELINYTFNQNAAFNVSMMVRLYDNYKEKHAKLDNYLPGWIHDMLIELGETELAQEWEIDKPYPHHRFYKVFKKYEQDISQISMNHWWPFIQNYRETTFFAKHKQKIYAIFKMALKLFQEINREEGFNLEEAWFEKQERTENRDLFRSAVVGRKVSSHEMTIIEYIPTYHLYSEVTALFRLSENVTRLLEGMKRQIQVEEQLLPEGFKERLLEVASKNRKNKIDKTEEKPPTIRSRFVRSGQIEKSQVESGSPIPPQPLKDEITDSQNDNIEPLLSSEVVEQLRQKHQSFISQFETEDKNQVDSQSSEPINQFKGTEVNTGVKAVEISQHPTVQLNAGIEESDYEGFIQVLNEHEVVFLQAFKDGKRSIEEVNSALRQMGIAAGVFVTQLNDKAEEYLDDVLIEQQGEYYIVNEELEEILEMVRRVKV